MPNTDNGQVQQQKFIKFTKKVISSVIKHLFAKSIIKQNEFYMFK